MVKHLLTNLITAKTACGKNCTSIAVNYFCSALFQSGLHAHAHVYGKWVKKNNTRFAFSLNSLPTTSIENETEMYLNQQSGNVIDAVSVRLYSVTPLQLA